LYYRVVPLGPLKLEESKYKAAQKLKSLGSEGVRSALELN
jgi:hypothetical protein